MIGPGTTASCRVLVAERLGAEGLDLLLRAAQVDVRLKLAPAELQALIPGYHVLIVRSGTRVNADLLEAGRDLIVVGRAGVGVDNIDVEAATRLGITVVNAPTTNIVAAAEHTIALVLALARKVPRADRSLRAGQWQRDRFVGVELVGKQLGLIGLGRVGGEVARRAVGLGMEVIAFDPYVSPERAQQLHARLAPFDQVLSTCDFVSLHAPVTSETRKLVGAPELRRIKHGAFLINVARGALVDTNALLDALDAGTLAGAALDVFEQEPPRDPRLLADERLVLTPHIGGSTIESQRRVSVEIAEKVLAVLQGRPARFAANAPFIPPSLAPILRPFMDLAERLGRFYTQWVGGPLDSIEIQYAGEIAAQDTAVLTAAVIKGLLEPIHEDRVTVVNATRVAQMHGLKFSEFKTNDAVRYENTIGIKGKQSVTGTVLLDRPHIVQLDDYWVDLPADGYLLLTRHRDTPGMIGKVGSLLGSADVNIASMQVARHTPRGESIMVLNLDDPVPAPVFEQLRAEPDIQWVKVLQL